MNRDIDALLKAGNQAQREKLELYGHKSDWIGMDFEEVASLIYEESEEVHEELIKRGINISLLRQECADLANACHFMICLCDKELSK